MRSSRIIEFTAAIAVALLAVFLYGYAVICALEISSRDEKVALSVTSFFLALLILVVPAVSLGIGSYFHSIKQRDWAFYLMLTAGAVNNLLIVALFVGIVWLYPGWAVLLFILQFLLVLVAVAAALFSRRNPTSARSGLAGRGLLW